MAESGSWNQYESTPISLSAPMCSRTVATASSSPSMVRPRRTLTPAKPRAMHWFEVVGMPLGALLEHRRAGAVQRDRVGAGAQQLVHRRVQGLAEDVPQGDLHRANGLAAEALPAEIAVEGHLKVGDSVTDGQRIASLQMPRAHVVHHGPKDRRIRVAPVGGRLAPAHGAVVGLDAHQREAALHVRGRSCGSRRARPARCRFSCLQLRHGRSLPHACSSVMVGRSLMLAAPSWSVAPSCLQLRHGRSLPHACSSVMVGRSPHACSSVMVDRSLMLAAPFPAAPATDRRARGPA